MNLIALFQVTNMKKILIEKEYRNEILKMHGFLKEQQTPTTGTTTTGETKVAGKVFVDAIAAGCLPGPKTKIKKQNKNGEDFYVYVETAKSGKLIYFYENGTYVLSDGSKKGMWQCPEVLKKDEPKKTTPTPTQTQSQNIGTPDLVKTSQEARLETQSTQDLSQTLKTINQNLSTDLSFDACTQLVDTYFELAKKGQADKNIPTYQSKIYACNNTHRSKWKEGTKDKLRWLSGNEEQAKQIFGLFKKFPRVGNIGDTPGRKEWRLRQLPPIE